MISFSPSFRISVSVALLSLAVAVTAEATSIVAIKTGDDIFIGTDSKVLIEKDVAISQCKITKMNDIYLVFSGIPALPAASFNAYEIAETIFAGKGSIAARLDAYDKAVQGKLQAAFEKLRTTDAKLFPAGIQRMCRTALPCRLWSQEPSRRGPFLPCWSTG